MKKTQDGLRKRGNGEMNRYGSGRLREADVTRLWGELEFIRLARKEIARLDEQYMDLKRECAGLSRGVRDIGRRIVRFANGRKGARSAADMVVRVKGLRREQFMLALELKSVEPRRSMYDIALAVVAELPPRGGDGGFPTWKSLHRYMSSMNRKYGCFE